MENKTAERAKPTKKGNNWFLVIRDGFWKSHPLDIIRENEKEYGREAFCLYVEMLTDSLSYDGRLRFSDSKPYTIKTLAGKFKTPENIVKECIDILEKNDLIYIEEDGTFVLTKFHEYTSFKSVKKPRISEAERKAQYRLRKRLEAEGIDMDSESSDEGGYGYESDDGSEASQEMSQVSQVSQMSQKCPKKPGTKTGHMKECPDDVPNVPNVPSNNNNKINKEKEEEVEEEAVQIPDPVVQSTENPFSVSSKAVSVNQVRMYFENINERKAGNGQPVIPKSRQDEFINWLIEKNFNHKGVITISRLSSCFQAFNKFRNDEERNEQGRKRDAEILRQANERSAANDAASADRVSNFMLVESEFD